MALKFYAIKNGRKPGIYTNWPQAQAQVKGFSGAKYKSFPTKEEALAYLNDVTSSDSNSIVENVSSTNADLVNKCNSIGSDETGKGEIFRSLIVTASFVSSDNVETLEKMGVKDSKAYGKNPEKLAEIGRALCGIDSEYDIDWNELKKGIFTRTDYASTLTIMLPNKEYESIHTETYNQDSILVDYHLKAIEMLSDAIKNGSVEYIVIDDFMNNNRTSKKRAPKYQKLQDTIADVAADAKLLIETKADARFMSVSAASIISTYFEQLYLRHLSEILLTVHGVDIKVPDGPINEKVRSFIKYLKANGHDEFFYEYAKVSYVKNL